MSAQRLLFVLGPSGAGKSTFISWLQTARGWYSLELDHRNVPEEASIKRAGLLSEWDALARQLNARPLAARLRARTLEVGAGGTVLSFSSLRQLSTAVIEELESHTVQVAILFGDATDLQYAFVARESTRRDGGLDLAHWRRHNQESFDLYKAEAYAPYRVAMFELGRRRECEAVLRDIIRRTTG